MTAQNVSEIDFRNYVQPVRVTAQHAQFLARALEAAAPADADPQERAAIAGCLQAATEVQEVLSDRDRCSAARVRPALLALGSAWAALAEILGGLARLAPDVSPRAARASFVLSSFFPEGVSFVKLDAGAAWSEGERRLTRMETEGLVLELQAMVGPDVIASVRKAQGDLRVAMGAGPVPRDVPSSTALLDALGTFSRAVSAYCRILTAKVVETDPASVDRFRRAVLPLDEYRASRRGSDDEAVEATPTGPPIAPGLPGAPPFESPRA